jgi:hypothetical protein
MTILLDKLHQLENEKAYRASWLDLRGVKQCHDRIIEILAELDKFNLNGGEPCNHPGCLHHITHPCEGCGRITGFKKDADNE